MSLSPESILVTEPGCVVEVDAKCYGKVIVPSERELILLHMSQTSLYNEALFYMP